MTRRRAPESVNRIRCEVCTRTSSEEGLEQEFNSLDAQREAGEAYIRSQAAGEARSPRRGAARGVAGTQSTGVPTAGVVPSPTNAARGTLSGCGATASRRHRASVCTLTPTPRRTPPPPRPRSDSVDRVLMHAWCSRITPRGKGCRGASIHGRLPTSPSATPRVRHGNARTRSVVERADPPARRAPPVYRADRQSADCPVGKWTMP